ncbi:MAG: hypothetical protein BMS9Abin36_0690 [Gammaproteobacteria bacterium]|nr:MAG: hypothetical protein BMS9Abin36_0690 [Gammaproteobacteria bacterium]
MAGKVKNALPKGYQLQQYRIERAIAGGGFGIVYLATDTTIDEHVAIKEYLPSSKACRLKDASVQCNSEENATPFKQGLKRFFEEASALAKLNHPNIVHVQNFFRDNNTVYMVMDYEKGRDLRFYIKRHGKLSEKFIRTVFPELLLGLEELHKHNLLHLDIKPANIFLRQGGKPLLLDFGAVREALDGQPSMDGPHTLTRGFAPIEQHQHKAIGPWTDFYALGASMYACIAGKPPPAATDRLKRDIFRPASITFTRHPYSVQLLEAVDWCLQLSPTDRPQSVKELLDFLNESSDTATQIYTPWYLTPISMPWSKK